MYGFAFLQDAFYLSVEFTDKNANIFLKFIFSKLFTIS